ncbi:putative single-stranded DNA binding protein [Mycosarcoma maydis]|uniref:Mitochondrial genome maintenance protein MGM101 n=1 Tax=Mycosarcoma maydis TaxID=5270 RepID=MG101_MYCMD|nr:putative single-stranded DNA binding protein [Ustilago maydis 521]Q4P4Y2.1 RecName: Full=Mitochondrial genome maintenance protein MGM101; Flags: Precursor [Ustilago maydis 521]KIS66769.1 putative single-stranded DNA binding protein [Ustilago maydis 521]|eukprot:XP_011391684.1 putative single-stranded DNA binding protein [Ustilago maydis 521]
MRTMLTCVARSALRQTSMSAPARACFSASAPALSSRSRNYSKQQQQQPVARTGLKDLHPLPESMREQLESSDTPQEPYTASGNSNDPAVHSSRPASQPAEPEVSPRVAAPGLVNGSSSKNGSPSSASSNGASSSGASSSGTYSSGNASIPISNISEAWGTSFAGLGERSFSKEAIDVLMAPINEADVEIKPDGLIYLPEIKYRRILNKAFGPGGWGMAPRSETNVGQGIVSREWVLICQGRFVATARGEQEFFKPSGVPTASEGAKSNALMRCCKDLGVSSELWDPRFIRQFRKKHCIEVWAQDTAGKKKKLWRRKDDPPFEYPWKETGTA